MMPRLLDLFCGAGGATRGYQDAGFEVVGVDIVRSKNYVGDRFVEADAMDALTHVLHGIWGERIDAIHASPPCQAYSGMSNCRSGLADTYPALIEPVREQLGRIGLPYVIENVPGAPLLAPVMLCGHMFGLPLYRHRLFETSFPMPQPVHPPHTLPASKAGHWKPDTIISVAGHCSPIALAREAMGVDWMTRDELAEAIPPAYAQFVGEQLVAELTDVAA